VWVWRALLTRLRFAGTTLFTYARVPESS